MALRALTAISALKKVVEVGLVEGTRAATTPIGQAISYRRRAGSCRMTPTVFRSRMLSQTTREPNSFLSFLWAATPYPVSSCAMRPRRSEA